MGILSLLVTTAGLIWSKHRANQGKNSRKSPYSFMLIYEINLVSLWSMLHRPDAMLKNSMKKAGTKNLLFTIPIWRPGA